MYALWRQPPDRSCLKQMEEKEILDMQLKDKISRTVLKQECNKRYPERGESYASKVTQKGTGKVIGAEVEGQYGINMNKEGEQMEADMVGAKRGREEVEGGESASEEDNSTSENNERLRNQARKMFDELSKSNSKGKGENLLNKKGRKTSSPHPEKRSGKSNKEYMVAFPHSVPVLNTGPTFSSPPLQPAIFVYLHPLLFRPLFALPS